MPIYCFNRPNRSERRKFTATDASRVCRYAVENEGQALVRRELSKCLGDDLCEQILSLALGALLGLLISVKRMRPFLEVAAALIAIVVLRLPPFLRRAVLRLLARLIPGTTPEVLERLLRELPAARQQLDQAIEQADDVLRRYLPP